MHCALITFADESDAARARGDRAVYVHGAEHAQRVDRSPLAPPRPRPTGQKGSGMQQEAGSGPGRIRHFGPSPNHQG